MTTREEDLEAALKPCPFCGSRAVTTEGDKKWYVTCTGADCFCAIGEGYDRDAMPDHIFYSEDDAIDAWNRRALSRASREAGTGERVGLSDLVQRLRKDILYTGHGPSTRELLKDALSALLERSPSGAEEMREACATVAERFATYWQRGSDDADRNTDKGKAFGEIASEVARQFAGCATQIRALPLPETGWRTMESAPKDGAWILGWESGGSVYRISWGKNHNDQFAWCSVAGSFVPGAITHWLPLPAPPAQGEKT